MPLRAVKIGSSLPKCMYIHACTQAHGARTHTHIVERPFESEKCRSDGGKRRDAIEHSTIRSRFIIIRWVWCMGAFVVCPCMDASTHRRRAVSMSTLG